MIDIVSWTADIETNMRALANNEYARFQDPANKWWDAAATRLTIGTRTQILAWFINSARLYAQGQGGNFSYQNPLQLKTSYTPETSGAAVEIRRQEIEDIDGNGVLGGAALGPITQWAKDMGYQFGYWPQLKTSELVIAGETTDIASAYDGLAFFSTGHYRNGVDSSDGVFSNLLLGSGYRIDSGVTLDQAAINLAAVYAAMRGVKFANGQVRMLRPAAILCGPAMYPRVAQLVDAKFLAIAAASGGGSGDFSGYTARMGYGKVIEAPELVGADWDDHYVVLADRGAESDLGAFVYLDREPYSIRYYTGRGGGTGVDAALDSADILKWHASGRNIAGYGHPFLAFKCGAT